MLTFVRHQSGLYFPEGVAPENARLAFLFADSGRQDESITLQATWAPEMLGYYALFAPRQGGWDGFAAQARSSFEAGDDRRIGWLDADGDPTGAFVEVAAAPVAERVLASPLRLPFRNVQLQARSFTSDRTGISLDGDTFHVQNKQVVVGSQSLWTVVLETTPPHGDLVQVPAEGDLLLPMSGAQPGNANVQLHLATETPPGEGAVSLASLEAGCLYFAEAAEGEDLLTALRYPLVRPAAAAEGTLGDGATLAFDCFLDLNLPEDPDRSFFAFADAVVGSYFATTLGRPLDLAPESAPESPSGSGGNGDPGARFVFANRPVTSVADQGHYYLTPAGSFRLRLPAAAAAPADDLSDQLLCADLGTEALDVVAGNGTGGDLLTFEQGRAAYRLAPAQRAQLRDQLRASSAGAADPTSAFLSTENGNVTTSWLRLTPSGAANTYYGQPQESPLYQQDAGESAAPSGAYLLSFKPIPIWPSGPNGAGTGAAPGQADQDGAADPWPVPMVPYAGIDAAETVRYQALQTMETEGLNPARKALFVAAAGAGEGAQVAAGADAEVATVSTWAMTSQSLLAGFTPADLWTALRVAISGSGTLQLTEMGDAMRRALNQNQIFLVTSTTRDGSLYQFAGTDQQIEVADWLFDLSPEGLAGPAGNPPILLFKFYDGRSITELVDDLALWSEPDTFNGDAAAIQSFLQAGIQAACEKVYGAGNCPNGPAVGAQPDTGSLYYPFWQAVTDPSFAGLLAVNCNISLEDLPGAIKSVLGGMRKADGTSNIEAFRAHHVGVQINDTKADAAMPQLGKSSLFGLVDYEKPGGSGSTSPAVTTAYGFEVEYLRSLFTNSELREFQCKIDLTINELFSVDVNLGNASAGGEEASGGNVISILGQYQAHSESGNDATSGEGVYSFVVEAPFPPFTFDDNPYLDTLTLSKVQFSASETTQDGETATAAGTSTIRSRFSMWGEMKFKDLNLLDLFSFEKLTFADMGITMGYDLTVSAGQPPVTTAPELAFAPGNLRFDLTQSKERQTGDSLLALLPFKLKSFLYSENADQPLSDLGYFALGLPDGWGADNPEVDLQETFNFALIFDLDLGGVGALVGSLEAFKFSMLLGWQPPSETTSRSGLTIGIQLPEADGKLEISIEGVLKILIKRFQLQYQTPDGGDRLLVVAMLESSVEILGKRLPPKGDVDFALFVPLKDGKDGEIGWIVALNNEGDGAARRALPAAGDEDGTNDDKAVFDLLYLGLGQRTGPDPKNPPKTFQKFLDFMTGDFYKAFENKEYGKVYHPESDWLVLSHAKLLGIVELGFIFYDVTPFYSLKLSVEKVIEIEITYTKVSDSVGLFHIEVGLPDAVRKFNVGAASVTLPMLGIDVYTNGDWKVDVGFPEGDDWSRSAQIQAQAGPIPVTGSGGFYIARLSSATSDLFQGTYDLIAAFGFALRLGVGKDFTQGPLKAGVSLTFYGIIEGAAAYDTADTAELEAWLEATAAGAVAAVTGAAGRPGEALASGSQALATAAGVPTLLTTPNALYLKGEIGVIGEIYGSIDFKIIQASVNVKIRAAIGLQLLTEIETSILLYVEASVTVSVTVKINLGLFKVKIGFSFKASFRFEWKLVESGQQAGLLASGARLAALGITGSLADAEPAWDPTYPLVAGLDGDVGLWYLPELTVAFDPAKPSAAGEAALVSSLGVEYLTPAGTGPVAFADFKPFEVLATQMVFWAVATAKVPGAPGNVTLEQLQVLDQEPEWLTGGLSYQILEQQLGQNFQVAITDVGTPSAAGDDEEEKNASVFPMIPFLRLVTDGRLNGSGDPDDLDYVFDTKNPVSEEYVEVTLQAWFDQLLVNTSADEPVDAVSSEALQPLAEALFTEYFRGVVRSGIDQIVQMMQDRDLTEGSLQDLVETAVGYGYFRDLAGSMANNFRHGLRLPTPDGATAPPGFTADETTTALYALLWQEFSVGALSPIAFVAKPQELEPTASYTVKLENPDESKPWVTSTVDWPLTDTQVAPYRDVTPDAIGTGGDPEILPLLERGPQSFAFQNSLDWTASSQAGGTTERSLRPFPPNLSQLLSQIGAGLDPGTSGIDVSVQTRTTDKAFAPDGTPVDPGKLSWALLLPLTVTKVPAGTGEGDLDHVYTIGGADPSIQRLLRLLLDQMAGGDGPVQGIEILYQPSAGAQELDSAVDPKDVFLLRTNTTTQSRPPQLAAALATRVDEPVPVAASLDDFYAFLRILEQASVTNAPGYDLYYDGLSSVDGGDLPAALFPGGATSAPLYVLVTLAGETPTNPSANGRAPIYGNTLVIDEGVTDLLYAATTDAALETYHVSVAAGAAGIGFVRTDPTATLQVTEKLLDALGDALTEQLDQGQRDGSRGLSADELEEALRRAGVPDGYRRRRMIADAGGAAADLNLLYSMVTFRTDATDGFIESHLSMPSGPQRESEDSTETEYRVFVPLYKVAKSNQPLEPGKYLDRYAEIGQPWGAKLWLTDAFGNLLPSPKTVPAGGADAPKNLYFDDLVPVAEWAGVRTDYDFLVGDTPRESSYTVYLVPDQSSLDALVADGSAGGMLDLYRTIDSQIGADGVSFYTRTDLDPAFARQALTSAQEGAVRQMVSGILRYLEGGSYDFAPVALSVTITGTGTLPELFPISVSLGIQRDKSLIDPQLEADGKILYTPAQDVFTDVPARQSVEGGAALDAFAAQFVGAFPELVLSVGPAGSILPAGSGIERAELEDDDDDSQADRPKAFWAVQRNLVRITIGPGGDPSYAAPKPMDTSLNTGVVPLPQDPVLDLPPTRTFADVDLDDFGRSFFSAVDRFLAPGPATSAYQVDASSYETVARARRTIADEYSRYEVDWLFPDAHRGSPDDLEEAREAFGQQMRQALGSAYAIDTVIQYPVVFDDALPPSVTDRIALFGQVRRSGATDPASAAGLSTAKVDAAAGSGGQTSLLTFLYGTPEIEDEKEADLDLVFDVSHVEYYLEPKSSGSDDEAPPSIWLQLVDPYPTGAPHVGPDGQRTDIPLVLREYPTPPTTIAQIATQGGGSDACGGSDLRKATSWHLDYQYQARLTVHDQIWTTVRYNTDLSASGGASANAALAQERYTLFQSLARFIAVYGVIGPQILDLQPTTPPDVVRAFAAAVATVASNSDWTEEAAALRVGMTTAEDRFVVTDVVESESGGVAKHKITMCPGTTVVPGALVQIAPFDPASLAAGRRAPRPATGRGTSADDCQEVTYDAPASETFVTHQMEVDCLSVLLTENALAGVQLARNAELLGTEPQTEFIYKTPLVRFTQPVTPFIDNATPVDVPSQVQAPSPPTLANWIDALLETLLANTGDLETIVALFRPGRIATPAGDPADEAIYRRLKMETRFAYPLATVGGGTAEDSPFAPRVPVVLARSFELQVNDGGAAIQEFSDEYAAGIEAWTTARSIALGTDDPPGVRLVFDITLYGQLSKTEIPVLRLRDLRLPLEVIQPAAGARKAAAGS